MRKRCNTSRLRAVRPAVIGQGAPSRIDIESIVSICRAAISAVPPSATCTQSSVTLIDEAFLSALSVFFAATRNNKTVFSPPSPCIPPTSYPIPYFYRYDDASIIIMAIIVIIALICLPILLFRILTGGSKTFQTKNRSDRNYVGLLIKDR